MSRLVVRMSVAACLLLPAMPADIFERPAGNLGGAETTYPDYQAKLRTLPRPPKPAGATK